jgi:hypothetical protein
MTPPVSAPGSHFEDLVENLEEVEALLTIHASVAGSGPGRKWGVEVLNKSAVVLVVACWEAFVEDTVEAALKFMIENATDHTIFPKLVLERVASKHSGPAAWSLAGDGWKKAMRDNLAEVLAKTTGALNTPRAAQVDDLFAKTIGLQNLSTHWRWTGRRAATSIDLLDQLITLRGSIAHRVKSSRSVVKRDVHEAIDLVTRLAASTHNTTRTYVMDRTGHVPWVGVHVSGRSRELKRPSAK